VEGFIPGKKITIDTGASLENGVIAIVGTSGATTVNNATQVGTTVIPVASGIGFREGQSVTVGSGDDSESAVIASIRRFGGTAIVVATPLSHAHAVGAQVSGSGITLTSALTRAHEIGAQVWDNAPTPGAPNRYYRRHD
jgi:hypothetical protein